MDSHAIADELNSIATANDFPARSADLVDAWTSDNVGVEAVASILRFMEEHPLVDFGAPGALVHFVEKFYRRGYEEKLLESTKRKPTSITVWMLNRLLNGAKDEEEKRVLVKALEEARANPRADSNAVQMAKRFLDRRV
jgi:hypothetical protein